MSAKRVYFDCIIFLTTFFGLIEFRISNFSGLLYQANLLIASPLLQVVPTHYAAAGQVLSDDVPIQTCRQKFLPESVLSREEPAIAADLRFAAAKVLLRRARREHKRDRQGDQEGVLQEEQKVSSGRQCGRQ